MGSIQWSAPEILTGQVPSKEADIFALAMVIVEGCHKRFTKPSPCLPLFLSMQVFSGTTPFGNVPDTLAILSITQGKRPPRPTHPDVSKGLWELIERCWDDRPSSRPEAPNVLESLLNSSVYFLFWKSPTHTSYNLQESSCMETVDRPHTFGKGAYQSDNIHFLRP